MRRGGSVATHVESVVATSTCDELSYRLVAETLWFERAYVLATLRVLHGPDEGHSFDLPVESAVIGRSSEHVPLSDSSASRRHAEIHAVHGQWVLSDLNSSNGTYVNGMRVLAPTPLKAGDRIKVGRTVLLLDGDDVGGHHGGASDVERRANLQGQTGTSGPSVLGAVGASGDSVILQPPEATDAVAAWNVVYRIAEMIGIFESVDALLEHVADVIFTHLIVDRLVLLTRDDDANTLIPQVVRPHEDPAARPPSTATSRTIIDYVLSTRDGVLCPNAMTDNRFGGADPQDSIHRLGLRSVICVPIISHNQIHGVIHLDCSMSHHTYTQEQLRLSVAIGRLTGMAIQNAKLLDSRVLTERLAATGETVAYLSHHIRNILQGLQGGAEVVELGLRKNNLDMMQSGWELVRRNLDRTLHLTTNMLTFSKERRPRVETTQLNSIVEDVVSLSQTRASEKQTTIHTQLGAIPVLPLDPEGIHQVIHNIVLNAIDAAPAQSGRVDIKTNLAAEGGRVTLSISDNGPGIPRSKQAAIFDVFHSAKGHAGTGLGLAAANKIVRELGGTIEVESTVGAGARFHVQLPVETIFLLNNRDGDQTDPL